jgi:hypothetical protein
MSSPTMPPGHGPNGERLDYDGPPRYPVTEMTVEGLVEFTAHVAVAHPDATVGVVVIVEDEDEQGEGEDEWGCGSSE